MGNFFRFFENCFDVPQGQNAKWPPFFIKIHSIVCQLEVLCWLELQIVVNHQL